jgi:hypothetical protein
MNTIPQRQSRTVDYDLVDDDSYYVTKQPTSAIRYVQPKQQVIQRGNKRIIIHDEPPPATRRIHWSLILGLGMVLALLLWMAASEALAWWSNHQLDTQYGMPRTYQTDALVYPSDTQAHPSHYIFLNLNGAVTIIELPQGDSAHARIYRGPSVYSNDPSYTPVTGEFRDVGGKMEMVVHVGDQQFVYINDGTQFKPQQ